MKFELCIFVEDTPVLWKIVSSLHDYPSPVYQLLLGGKSFKLEGVIKGGVIDIGVDKRREN